MTTCLGNRKAKIANESWLPDMDLNHDKQIQSLLCYRYTIGQSVALARLNVFTARSSQHTTLSVGFQSCWIADFQIGRWREFARRAGLETRDTADSEVCATSSASRFN